MDVDVFYSCMLTYKLVQLMFLLIRMDELAIERVLKDMKLETHLLEIVEQGFDDLDTLLV